MTKSKRSKKVLLWLAGLRALLGIVAIPLAPVLWERNFLVLVLLRPTKEVLLAGSFLARRGQVPLWQLVAAAVPLSILGVWQFFYLGRAYSREIQRGEVPGIGSRLLPSDKIKKLEKVLKKRGPRLVVIGRLAAFPSTLVGAAAGASRMDSHKFLRLDGLGGMLAVAEILAAGYLLGGVYERMARGRSRCRGIACITDPQFWVSPRVMVTAAGVLGLALLMFLFGRYLRKE